MRCIIKDSVSAYPDFRDLRSHVKSLAGLAAYQYFPVNVSDKSGLPERYDCSKNVRQWLFGD